MNTAVISKASVDDLLYKMNVVKNVFEELGLIHDGVLGFLGDESEDVNVIPFNQWLTDTIKMLMT